MNYLWLLPLVLAAAAAILILRYRRVTTIYPPMVGLLYRDGRFDRELPPGRYSFFDPRQRTRITTISTAELPSTPVVVCVLSKDQFSFRMTMAPVVSVTDARAFHESQPTSAMDAMAHFMAYGMPHPALHSLLSSAALEIVGGLALSEMMGDANLVAAGVQAKLQHAIPGAAITSVLVTDITLPPETRRMFTDVERAKMEALAGLERARGEQAALRVLANAARSLTDNPGLANLRLLQSIETAKGSTTIVLGNPSNLAVAPISPST